MNLDRYDRQILAILQSDGRISNQDLADRIGLSPSPCLRRVRALEESGLIAGYRAYLDAKKLGLTLMALIGISIVGLFVRALITAEFAGALFLAGFGGWFIWQIGGFMRRNRPRSYTFDTLPKDVLP